MENATLRHEGDRIVAVQMEGSGFKSYPSLGKLFTPNWQCTYEIFHFVNNLTSLKNI